MAFDIVRTTLSAAVASGGSITFSYPSGKDAGSYRGAYGHKLWAKGLMTQFNFPADFAITFGASNITVTYNGATSIPASTEVVLEADYIGSVSDIDNLSNTTKRAVFSKSVLVDFGAVDAASATAVQSATAVGTASQVTLGTAVTLDVPRNVVAVSSGAGDTTQSLTVYGYDEYGVAMTETKSLNGTTSVVFDKAFKTVTGYKASAALAGNLSLGSGAKLGLPVFIPYAAGSVLKEIQDGANATAGTVVAGVTAKATATTGDVRGTWTPNATPNGTIGFALLVSVPDPNYLGGTQA